MCHIVCLQGDSAQSSRPAASSSSNGTAWRASHFGVTPCGQVVSPAFSDGPGTTTGLPFVCSAVGAHSPRHHLLTSGDSNGCRDDATTIRHPPSPPFSSLTVDGHCVPSIVVFDRRARSSGPPTEPEESESACWERVQMPAIPDQISALHYAR